MNINCPLRRYVFSVIAAIAAAALTSIYGQPVTVRFLGEFGSSGAGAGQFQQPAGVAVTNLAGAFSVADSANGRIQQFDAQGNFQAQWSTRVSLPGSSPFGLAINTSTGDLTFTERGFIGFQIYDFMGDFKAVIGGALAPPPYDFLDPTGIAVNQNSWNIYVADFEADRIKYFNSSGTYLGGWGSTGSGPGEFDSPLAVAVHPDAGQVFVIDRGNTRIQRFSATGAFQTSFGGPGTGLGQFQLPNAIAITKDGLVLVADTSNDNVQIFNSDGVFQTSFALPGINPNPLGIAVNDDGIVFVTDIVANTVSRWQIVKPVNPPTPAPTPTPPARLTPTLSVKGKTKVRTSKGRVVLRGNATNASVVQYQSGKGGFKRAKGNSSQWKIPVRLAKGRTIVKVRATGPGGTSRVIKFTIKRR